MRTWAILLGGLIVWTVHFFALYIIASIFPGQGTARWLSALATLLCLAADIGLLLWIRRAGDTLLNGWGASIGTVLAALSLVAVLWQGLPILF